MASYVQTVTGVHPTQQYHTTLPQQRRHPSRHRFFAELSQCLFDFVVQLLPTPEEMTVKEDVRKLLERLIHTIEPNSRLLSFGSTANGFSLRNSDMDLCCLIDSEDRLPAGDLVTMLGDLLERETKFHVKPLPYARIPIVKLSLDPSPGLPLGIACDIGFENRLALENTRLLMCYAMIDPARVRTMVLFLKVWSKRRKINSPYRGTLSSYGYVLLVIYFLVHVKNPPVLPNLQSMPPLRPISHEESHIGEHNTWFFDDIELLRERWQSTNTQTVAELLADFFKYYARDFPYSLGVASIREGLVKKESKGWLTDIGSYDDAREPNRFCIEDPFELDYNVARCVSKDGLFTIRGELMRASRIIAARPERPVVALSQLCEERAEEEPLKATSQPRTYVPQRPSPLPPQTPYTVTSSSLRPNGVPVCSVVPEEAEKSSPTPTNSTPVPGSHPEVPMSPPPDHMGPRRSKWTSPPPDHAPLEDLASFEDRLGEGLLLATASSAAREAETSYTSSSNTSEVFTDDGVSSDVGDLDDVRSVRSFTEEAPASQVAAYPLRSPSFSYESGSGMRMQVPPRSSKGGGNRVPFRFRGRPANRPAEEGGALPPPVTNNDFRRFLAAEPEPPRRSMSNPGLSEHRYSLPAIPVQQPAPFQFPRPENASANVFYETGGAPPYALAPYMSLLSPYYRQQQYLASLAASASAAVASSSPPASSPSSSSPASPATARLQLMSQTRRAGSPLTQSRQASPRTPYEALGAGRSPFEAPAPLTPPRSPHQALPRAGHAHSHSTATIVPNGSPVHRASPLSRPFADLPGESSRSRSNSPSDSAPPPNPLSHAVLPNPPAQRIPAEPLAPRYAYALDGKHGSPRSRSGSESPTPSMASSHYPPSSVSSRSMSPTSPIHGEELARSDSSSTIEDLPPTPGTAVPTPTIGPAAATPHFLPDARWGISGDDFQVAAGLAASMPDATRSAISPSTVEQRSVPRPGDVSLSPFDKRR